MRGKAAGWAVFLLCLLALSFAATTRYSETADLLLICLRLALLAGLSILVVREVWTQRKSSRENKRDGSSGRDSILQRFRRWYYDDQKHPG